MRVSDVAAALGVSAQTVRVGLQKGLFPFGVAFKIKDENKNYAYVIYPKKFKEFCEEVEYEELID